MKKLPTLTSLQDTLVARILDGRTRHQGLALSVYKRQAAKLGYSDAMIQHQINQCYEVADLQRFAKQ